MLFSDACTYLLRNTKLSLHTAVGIQSDYYFFVEYVKVFMISFMRSKDRFLLVFYTKFTRLKGLKGPKYCSQYYIVLLSSIISSIIFINY